MLLCKLNNVNKVTEKEVYDRNWRAKKVVTNIHEEGLALTKRVAVHSADDAFITVKDHDEEFRTSKVLRCRLINPAKSELRRGFLSESRLRFLS